MVKSLTGGGGVDGFELTKPKAEDGRLGFFSAALRLKMLKAFDESDMNDSGTIKFAIAKKPTTFEKRTMWGLLLLKP